MHNFYILSPAKLFFNAKPSFHHGLKKYPRQEDTTSMVVMAVVIVECFGADLGCQRVVGIGQRRQRKLRLLFCGCIHNG